MFFLAMAVVTAHGSKINNINYNNNIQHIPNNNIYNTIITLFNNSTKNLNTLLSPPHSRLLPCYPPPHFQPKQILPFQYQQDQYPSPHALKVLHGKQFISVHHLYPLHLASITTPHKYIKRKKIIKTTTNPLFSHPSTILLLPHPSTILLLQPPHLRQWGFAL